MDTSNAARASNLKYGFRRFSPPVPEFTISLDSEIPRQRLASGPQAHVRGQAWVFGGDPQNVRVLLNNRTNTRLTTVGLHPDNRRNNGR